MDGKDALLTLDQTRRDGDKIMVALVWLFVLYSLGLAAWHDTWAESLLVGIPTVLLATLIALRYRGSLF